MTDFASFAKTAAPDPNALVTDPTNLYSLKVTLVSGQNVAQGALLGRITTGGKYALSAAAASDGSQTPVAIAGHAVDASGGDQEILVHLTGRFSASRMVFGAGHTAASTREALAARGIQLDP
jgi:hypothetical protein